MTIEDRFLAVIDNHERIGELETVSYGASLTAYIKWLAIGDWHNEEVHEAGLEILDAHSLTSNEVITFALAETMRFEQTIKLIAAEKGILYELADELGWNECQFSDLWCMLGVTAHLALSDNNIAWEIINTEGEKFTEQDWRKALGEALTVNGVVWFSEYGKDNVD